MIRRYLKIPQSNGGNLYRGLVVSDLHKDEIVFGWSYCQPEDRFRREEAFILATSQDRLKAAKITDAESVASVINGMHKKVRTLAWDVYRRSLCYYLRRKNESASA